MLLACGGGGGGESVNVPTAAVNSASATPEPINCVVSVAAKNTVTFDTTVMTAICGNIYVDPSVASSAHAQLAAGYKNAIDTNKAVYGTLQFANPDIVVCNYISTNCANFFTGATLRNRILPPGSRSGTYVAPRWTVVLVSASSAANERITAHELSHLELAARLKSSSVPAWFNEGLATYIGNEPQCSSVTAKGISDLTLLTTGAQWETYTNDFSRINETYCQAKREVETWIAKNGTVALLQMIDKVRGGEKFNTLYGRLVTQ